ncbi:MAG TPA: TetR family transcriptional regulator [Caulobacteraceae bacterium]|nr:TetR family transcriptional regulator [Caulobacteraceae bacterium]
MNRKVEQGLETRREIIEAARRLFAEHGYAGVSIEQVLAASGVSRGALYHHFRGKEALFEAVFEAMEAEIAQIVLARSAAAASPAEALAVGGDAFLDLAREKAVRQIVLTDAPAALGWEKWRAIDAQHGFGLLKAALAPAAAEAGLPEAMVEPFAHMLLASLTEIALLIARAEDSEAEAEAGKAAIRELLGRILRTP